MKRIILAALVGVLVSGPVFSTPALAKESDVSENTNLRHKEIAQTEQCGTNATGEMLASGWKYYSEGNISTIKDDVIELDDGTLYEADMTIGIFEGDHALIFSKFVQTEKLSGFIYNLCAGGFDAWVRKLRPQR